jgi:hypothetical protein
LKNYIKFNNLFFCKLLNLPLIFLNLQLEHYKRINKQKNKKFIKNFHIINNSKNFYNINIIKYINIKGFILNNIKIFYLMSYIKLFKYIYQLFSKIVNLNNLINLYNIINQNIFFYHLNLEIINIKNIYFFLQNYNINYYIYYFILYYKLYNFLLIKNNYNYFLLIKNINKLIILNYIRKKLLKKLKIYLLINKYNKYIIKNNIIKINNLFINNQIKINKYLFINIYNILSNINKINICIYRKSNIIYKKILNYPKMYLNFNKKRNFNKNLFY